MVRKGEVMLEKVVIISPHPDDETLGAGGTILKFKEQGCKIFWLNMTIMSEDSGFSKRSVRKYCKENDIAIEGERKPSMYKKNIVDRWK